MKAHVNQTAAGSRSAEKGAVSIKTVLVFTILIVLVFALIKIVPVYYQQEKTLHETDELANQASLGLSAYGKDYVQKKIQEIIQDNDLPEGAVTVVSQEQGRTEIAVKYTRPIDFIVTTYNWDVDQTSVGKTGL